MRRRGRKGSEEEAKGKKEGRKRRGRKGREEEGSRQMGCANGDKI